MKRKPGQSAGLTREMVLDTAMAMVDQDGLRALSMRRLGSQLGVEAMTIYHYVPNKDALLDGLVERLLIGASDPLFADASWQSALRGFAQTLRTALWRHPNLVPLMLSRPAVTTQTLRLMESILHRLQDAGFPLNRGLDIIYSVAGFVVGQAASPTIEAEGDAQTNVLSAEDLKDFPLLAEATRISQATQSDRFDYALDAMLAGFQAQVS